MRDSVQHWCGPKADDPKPIIYHGTTARDAVSCIAGGQKAFCVTYYDVTKGSNLEHPGFKLDNGTRSFLDSGAFSFLVMGAQAKISRKALDEQSEQYCQHYSQWLKKHPGFDFYLTFDYVMEAPLVFSVTQKLRKLGIGPTPVYHGDASLDWLKRYIDSGYRLIALAKRAYRGDRKRLFRFYDQCFNIGEKTGTKFHGLAVGLGPETFSYPWYSIDSTTIVTAGGKLCALLTIKNKNLDRIYIGKRGRIGKALAAYIRDRGFNPDDLLESYDQRIVFNAKTITELQKEKQVKAWQKRTLF